MEVWGLPFWRSQAGRNPLIRDSLFEPEKRKGPESRSRGVPTSNYHLRRRNQTQRQEIGRKGGRGSRQRGATPGARAVLRARAHWVGVGVGGGGTARGRGAGGARGGGRLTRGVEGRAAGPSCARLRAGRLTSGGLRPRRPGDRARIVLPSIPSNNYFLNPS